MLPRAEKKAFAAVSADEHYTTLKTEGASLKEKRSTETPRDF